MPERCGWTGDDPLMIAYHDTEWGVPVHDDRRLFEALVLGGAQAGLSWRTILHRREGYRNAFAGFDPRDVARFGQACIRRRLADPDIIRNRRKIESAVGNARAFLAVAGEFGSFDAYLWAFTGGRVIVNRFETLSQLPAVSPLAEVLSADLRCRGFTFVGPTICYAFLQAVGVVNDHLVGCFRHPVLEALAESPLL